MNDKWGRNFLGTPPQGRADYAFFQHILASMDEQTGRCAILFPHGVLGRDEEKDLRAKLVEADVVDCVIGIGRNLFYNSPMEACIILCQSKKSDDRKNKVLFIDAKDNVTRKNAESYLEPNHIKEIVEIYNNYTNIEGVASVVDLETIIGNENSLTIQMYVASSLNKSYNLNDSLEEYVVASDLMHNELDKLYKLFLK
jgi:type I restriction enzyme M protein